MNQIKSLPISPYILIILLGSILFFPNLGVVHLFDWDEINFAEISREMLVSGNFGRVQVEFLPFWEKPPLFFWLQSFCMYVFGVNEFSARLPNALIGIVTLLVLFYIGKKTYNTNFGWLWILMYIGSFLPAFYFKSGIIDPLFNLCIFLSLYQLCLWSSQESQKIRYKHAFLGGIFMGMSILAKGPVALLLVGVSGLIFWILSKKWNTFRPLEIVVYAVMTLLVASIWFLPEILKNGTWFLKEFIDYQIGLAFKSEDSGHEQPFWYHPIVLLLGCFPASVYFLGIFSKNGTKNIEKQKNIKTNQENLENSQENTKILIQNNFILWNKLLFFTTLIIFSIVKAKIIHYSSLCYFPLTFLACLYIFEIENGERKAVFWHKYLLLFIGFLWGMAIFLVPLIDFLKPTLIPIIDDKFLVMSLQSPVVWGGFEWILGVFFLIGLVYFLFFIQKKENNGKNSIKIQVLGLLGVTVVSLQLLLVLIIPKVERYTQGNLIDFLKNRATEDCFVSPYNFHSYAHHYYAKVSMENAQIKRTYLENTFGKETLGKNSYSTQKDAWNAYLISGNAPKTAYLIVRENGDKYPQLEKLEKVYDKYGFRIFKKSPPAFKGGENSK